MKRCGEREEKSKASKLPMKIQKTQIKSSKKRKGTTKVNRKKRCGKRTKNMICKTRVLKLARKDIGPSEVVEGSHRDSEHDLIITKKSGYPCSDDECLCTGPSKPGKQEAIYLEEFYKYNGFYFTLLDPPAIVYGGTARVQPNSNKYALLAVDVALSNYNKINMTELEAKKLLRANSSYSDYSLTFELSDGKFYEASVRYDRRCPQESVVKFMEEARFYPEIEDCYTYHEFE